MSHNNEKKERIPEGIKQHRSYLNRQCVTRCRAKKAEEKATSENTTSLSGQVLAKAVPRLKKALLKSLRRKPLIVRRLAESMGLIEPDSVRISHNKISDVTIEQVNKFYMRDDVSRQAPGLKDYGTVWGENGKERLQK